MALPDQQAAHRDERGGAEAEFLGAEDRGNDDVTAGLDAAIGTELYAVPQPVQHEHLMYLGQAHFPRDAGIFDRALRRGAGAAAMAGDQDDVGLGLGHAGRDRADTGAGDQLDADLGLRVDLLQIVDQLRQILDRVDVVMRRRRDQRDAFGRVPQSRDQAVDFEARQLAAFAGLGALRDLDLQLAAIVQGNPPSRRTGRMPPA